MKKTIVLFLSLFLLLSGCAKVNETDKKLNVVTSVYPIYDFTKKIAGDKVNVIQIVPDGVDLHEWEPQASDIVAIEKANLFIYNGAGLEHWVDSVLQSLSNKKITSLDTSEKITLLDSHHEKHNHEHDSHDHGADPHLWLNPINASSQMLAIKDELVKVDPENKDYYLNNYNKYHEELLKLDEKYKSSLKDLKSRDIVVAHEAFGYLCDAYDLHQVGIAGLEPSIEPDAARMGEIVDYIKKNKINIIFFEEQASSKVALTISKEAKVKTMILSPIETRSEKQKQDDMDYFAIMKENLEQLLIALK